MIVLQNRTRRIEYKLIDRGFQLPNQNSADKQSFLYGTQFECDVIVQDLDAKFSIDSI